MNRFLAVLAFALVLSACAADSVATAIAKARTSTVCTDDADPQPGIRNCDSAQALCTTDTDCFVRFGE
jgi:hypothetical protein